MERRLARLMDDYGLDSLADLGDELFSPLRARHARRHQGGARRHVPLRHATPTGSTSPSTSRSPLTVRGDEIVADYAGTSPQQPRAINCVLAYTYAMTAYARALRAAADLANNEGMYRPVKVTAPEGSLLNPRFPAAVVSRSNTGHYVPTLVFGALHQVMPDRVMAGVRLAAAGP